MPLPFEPTGIGFYIRETRNYQSNALNLFVLERFDCDARDTIRQAIRCPKVTSCCIREIAFDWQASQRHSEISLRKCARPMTQCQQDYKQWTLWWRRSNINIYISTPSNSSRRQTLPRSFILPLADYRRHSATTYRHPLVPIVVVFDSSSHKKCEDGKNKACRLAKQ